ncbi:Vacuolar sorting protein 3, partial [Linum perenne]
YRYLQWLIEDQDSVDTNIHTLYALSLAKSAIETFDLETSFEDSDDGRIEVTRFPNSEKSLIFQSPVRERLQIFLQSSDLYDPEDVLELIEGSELWLEKAILYRKLGQETLVLQILALLLDMYLDPQNGKEPMFNAAVRLLHNHGESLDPLHVLETLSGSMPLQLASDTVLRMLRARVHHHHQGKPNNSSDRADQITVFGHIKSLVNRVLLVYLAVFPSTRGVDFGFGTRLQGGCPRQTWMASNSIGRAMSSLVYNKTMISGFRSS